MEFRGWKTINYSKVNPKWLLIQNKRVFPSPAFKELKTPKQILTWVRENITYTRDVGDNWQTPNETLVRKAGDCEDFCILMRALLINAGFDSSKIWMMIGNDLIAKEAHAVLVFEDKFVLDQRCSKVLLLEMYMDFTPVLAYSDKKAVIFGRKINTQ